MYCDKCHKHSPDNFVACAYCGARFNSKKKKEPHKFVKRIELKPRLTFKNVLRIFIAIGVLLVVAAIITATFVENKPERTVKQMVKAVENGDADAYYGLYDEHIISYKTENLYFGEEETYEQMTLPLEQSHEFYVSKCGEDFTLIYNIKSERELEDSELEAFNRLLNTEFDYMEFPTKVEILELEIIAEGEQGEYKSVYTEFWCMKIRGNWYLVDKKIVDDYNNL